MSYFFSEFCSRDCLWEFCYDYFHYVHSASPTLLPLQPLVSKDLNLVCNLSWMILGACYVGSTFLNSTTFPNSNRTSWWDDRAGGHRLWLWGWTWLLSLTATHLNKDNDHGCSDRKLIKCLMDSADDLSGYMPIRTASTWDYGVGPLRCSLVRGLSDVSFT